MECNLRVERQAQHVTVAGYPIPCLMRLIAILLNLARCVWLDHGGGRDCALRRSPRGVNGNFCIRAIAMLTILTVWFRYLNTIVQFAMNWILVFPLDIFPSGLKDWPVHACVCQDLNQVQDGPGAPESSSRSAYMTNPSRRSCSRSVTCRSITFQS